MTPRLSCLLVVPCQETKNCWYCEDFRNLLPLHLQRVRRRQNDSGGVLAERWRTETFVADRGDPGPGAHVPERRGVRAGALRQGTCFRSTWAVVGEGKCLRVKVPPSVWAKTAHHSGLKLVQVMYRYIFKICLNGMLFWPHIEAPPPEYGQNSTLSSSPRIFIFFCFCQILIYFCFIFKQNKLIIVFSF